jgi:NADPH2:quinone reductase
MTLGTAGFTAALAIHRMEQNAQRPDGGPIVVTGASGGVGSIAVNMLAGRGYEVVAVSGKADAEPYLRELGAARVLNRAEIDTGSRPLEKTQWAGAIDNVGGELLTWLTRTVDFWGNIASIGLAASHKLETTVMPFILRGVSLLGINSSAMPRDVRTHIWQRLATDLKPRHPDPKPFRSPALHLRFAGPSPLARTTPARRHALRWLRPYDRASDPAHYPPPPASAAASQRSPPAPRCAIGHSCF